MKPAALSFLLMFLSLPAWSAWEDLTPGQKEQVLAGEQVILTQNVGTPWPKVWIYQYIGATPEESAAVFADFNSREDIVEDIIDCTIIRKVAANQFDVECEVFVHKLFDNEIYVVRDVVHQTSNGYYVKWNKIRATTSQGIEGWVTYTPLRRGTLMTYYSYVIPSSGMARAVRRRALNAVSRAADSLTRSTVEMKRSEPAMLQSKVKVLREMLTR